MSAEQTVTNLAVLGATGSIGLNTLDVVRRHPQRFRVKALTSNSKIDVLLEQCREFRPDHIVVVDPVAADRLKQQLNKEGLAGEVRSGAESLVDIATLAEVDVVMAAIVGAAGLVPTLAAVQAGKRVLIANKEPLVMLGGVFVEEAQRSGAQILPIDSEHNAIFQCLPAPEDGLCGRAGSLKERGVRRILLTGSGGPFRDRRFEDLGQVTPEQACAHPNWVMGRKISVDSATMMNKGLEIIEACWLFNAVHDQVQVVVHPQSVIHSLVEYVDGSMLAQLGSPDMRVPIAHALGWPQRIPSGADALDLFAIARLDFEPPRPDTFPCLMLAQEAARLGGVTPAILNAANEVAVAAFLARRLAFTEIPRLIEHVLERVDTQTRYDLETVLAVDEEARCVAQAYLGSAHDRRNAG